MANVSDHDKDRGLYNKFRVERTDGSERHLGCQYFVLDLTHDPHAKAAIRAYVDACAETHPALADDLALWLVTGVTTYE